MPSTISKQHAVGRHLGHPPGRQVRRHFRLRKKVAGTTERPRLVVTRSARHIYAQVVDDTSGHTLASASTLDVTCAPDGDKTAQAKQVGALLAERAKAAGVEPSSSTAAAALSRADRGPRRRGPRSRAEF